MKQLLLVLLFISGCGYSCNRNGKPVEKPDFNNLANRKFDIETFNRFKKNVPKDTSGITFDIDAQTQMILTFRNSDSAAHVLFPPFYTHTTETDDSIKITRLDDGSYYRETWEYPNHSVTDRYEYYRNGNLRRYYHTFGMEIPYLLTGYDVYINEAGHIESVVNHDENFAFSLEDILEWAAVHSINVYNKNVYLYRNFRTENDSIVSYFWGIDIMNQREDSIRTIVLDSDFGMILSDSIFVDNEGLEE